MFDMQKNPPKKTNKTITSKFFVQIIYNIMRSSIPIKYK